MRVVIKCVVETVILRNNFLTVAFSSDSIVVVSFNSVGPIAQTIFDVFFPFSEYLCSHISASVSIAPMLSRIVFR